MKRQEWKFRVIECGAVLVTTLFFLLAGCYSGGSSTSTAGSSPNPNSSASVEVGAAKLSISRNVLPANSAYGVTLVALPAGGQGQRGQAEGACLRRLEERLAKNLGRVARRDTFQILIERGKTADPASPHR